MISRDAVREFIRAHWPDTIRNLADEAPENRLPAPFVVPTAGPHFRKLFYWDTYFASLGLVRDGRTDAALGSAECFLHLLETKGYVPNYAPGVCNRSQPPVASMLFRLVYEHTRDRDWLHRASAALDREYAFWMNLRLAPNGLNRAGHHAPPDEVVHFYYTIKDRLHPVPEEPVARMAFLAHAMAECEVWDFTPRFEKRCMDFNPVCLNSLLYALEMNQAFFAKELGANADLWVTRAARRKTLMDRYCWNESAGAYFDYDTVNRRQGSVLSVAAFFPLWTGMASDAQAEKVRRCLTQLEYPAGVTTCVPGPRDQTYQWDHPNAWPPMQLITVEGLRRYGYEEDARRIADKYLDTVTRNFAESGNLWEKYNAEDGSIRVKDEYVMPPMLGWTAGVFIHFHHECDVLKTSVQRHA